MFNKDIDQSIASSGLEHSKLFAGELVGPDGMQQLGMNTQNGIQRIDFIPCKIQKSSSLL
jgi:hypothetical protein